MIAICRRFHDKRLLCLRPILFLLPVDQQIVISTTSRLFLVIVFILVVIRVGNLAFLVIFLLLFNLRSDCREASLQILGFFRLSRLFGPTVWHLNLLKSGTVRLLQAALRVAIGFILLTRLLKVHKS